MILIPPDSGAPAHILQMMSDQEEVKSFFRPLDSLLPQKRGGSKEVQDRHELYSNHPLLNRIF